MNEVESQKDETHLELGDGNAMGVADGLRGPPLAIGRRVQGKWRHGGQGPSIAQDMLGFGGVARARHPATVVADVVLQAIQAATNERERDDKYMHLVKAARINNIKNMKVNG